MKIKKNVLENKYLPPTTKNKKKIENIGKLQNNVRPQFLRFAISLFVAVITCLAFYMM